MEALIQFIGTYGLWVVFFSVLLDQGGLPTPAYPPIIVTAALGVDSQQALLQILGVATLAAVLADISWYAAGRRFGGAMLRLMCKVSLSPDSCVSRTRSSYSRWGPAVLIFAKYVPGLAAVATTLAGETKTPVTRFILYDTIGAALWASGAVALGVIFSEAVEAVLMQLEQLGAVAFWLLVAALALFIALKWRERRAFMMQIRMARIQPQELAALLGEPGSVVILDVRSASRRNETGWIPGSIHAPEGEALDLNLTDEVIVYCECPNDASAAVVARKLKERGFTRVRPLAGGFDAWRAHGGQIENPSQRSADAMTPFHHTT